jgi:uncharacterized protein (TIGR02996 family)
MNRNVAFLQDILEHPDEDAPRLIYADWLEDQGDETRAEFIRLQSARARMPEDDPRREPYADREQQLVQEHQAEWIGPAGQRISAQEFRRGFLASAAIKADAFLEYGADLLLAHPGVTVRVEKLGSLLPALCSQPWLTGLRGLDLGNTPLGEEGVLTLIGSGHLTELRTLNLARTGLGIAGARRLAAAPSLSRVLDLDLCANDLRPAGVRALLQAGSWGQLESLGLDDNYLRDEGTEVLVQARQLTRLVSLDLRDNQMSQAGGLALAAASHWSALRKLDLGCLDIYYNPNTIGDRGVSALAGASHLGRLEELDLEGVDMTDAGLQALAASPHLGRLRKVNLAFNGIGTAGIGALAHSPQRTALEEVDLGYSWTQGGSPGADAVETLARSPLLERARSLVLTRFLLGGGELQRLFEGSDTSRLRELGLCKTELTAADFDWLLSWPTLQRLRWLDLRCNDLSAAVVQALSLIPRLKVDVDEARRSEP